MANELQTGTNGAACLKRVVIVVSEIIRGKGGERPSILTDRRAKKIEEKCQ